MNTAQYKQFCMLYLLEIKISKHYLQLNWFCNLNFESVTLLCPVTFSKSKFTDLCPDPDPYIPDMDSTVLNWTLRNMYFRIRCIKDHIIAYIFWKPYSTKSIGQFGIRIRVLQMRIYNFEWEMWLKLITFLWKLGYDLPLTSIWI